MDAPENFTFAGQGQSIYTVDVSTVALPPAGAQAIWSQHVAQIEALPKPPGVAAVIRRSFQLAPGVSAVWYHRNSGTAGLIALDAMKSYPSHALMLSRGADLSVKSATVDPEALVEKLETNIINAYVPQTGRGFCVGFGAITSKPSVNEHASVDFNDPSDSETHIQFETRTVTEPDTTTFSSLAEETAMGAPMNVLKEGARVVAGLSGKEIRISVAHAPAEGFVRFTWHFSGEAGSSDRPAIDIVGAAPLPRRARLESAWESFLSSVKRIPQ
jgi:hypothetical protein